MLVPVAINQRRSPQTINQLLFPTLSPDVIYLSIYLLLSAAHIRCQHLFKLFIYYYWQTSKLETHYTLAPGQFSRNESY